MERRFQVYDVSVEFEGNVHSASYYIENDLIYRERPDPRQHRWSNDHDRFGQQPRITNRQCAASRPFAAGQAQSSSSYTVGGPRPGPEPSWPDLIEVGEPLAHFGF